MFTSHYFPTNAHTCRHTYYRANWNPPGIFLRFICKPLEACPLLLIPSSWFWNSTRSVLLQLASLDWLFKEWNWYAKKPRWWLNQAGRPRRRHPFSYKMFQWSDRRTRDETPKFCCHFFNRWMEKLESSYTFSIMTALQQRECLITIRLCPWDKLKLISSFHRNYNTVDSEKQASTPSCQTV